MSAKQPPKTIAKYSQIKILSKRLSIRPFLLSDYQGCCESEQARLPIQSEFDELLFEQTLKSYEAFKKKVLLNRSKGQKRTHYILGVFERKSGRLVGQLDLFQFNEELKWMNLGYHIQNQSWGKGYAPEACRSLMKYAFKHLNIHRIEASMLSENTASMRVAKKLDLVYEGTRNHFFPDKKSGVLHVYGMNVFDAKK